MLRRNVGDPDGMHRIQAPASLLADKQGAQQRRANAREQLLGEGLVVLRGVLAEVDVELEAVALVVMQRLVHQRFELGRERAHMGLGLQVLHGLHVGKGALATGLGE